MTAYDAFEHYSRLESRCAELEEKMSSLTDVSRFNDVAISTSEAARFVDCIGRIDKDGRGVAPCETEAEVES